MSGDSQIPVPQAGMIADLRLLPQPFYLLMAGSFINRFGHFVIPFLAIYLRQLGFEPKVTGYALAAYGAGGFFASILGGYLADRIGRKPTLFISNFGAAVTMMILAFAESMAAFIVGGVGPMAGLWLFGMSPELLWVFCGILGLAGAGLILIRGETAPHL